MIQSHFAMGFFVTLIIIGAVRLLFSKITVQVEDEHAVLVTEFGRLTHTLKTPGLHFLPQRLNPACQLNEVSLQRDFRLYDDLHINDKNGTTVMVDLWVEFRIEDPRLALFEVENWEETLASAVAHASMSVLSDLEFNRILSGGTELSARILHLLADSSKRWGLSIERAEIRDVGLLPEVSKPLFESVAARLERAKALIEERGRLAIAELDAQTVKEVARLKGEAKVQYPKALSPVFARMARTPQVLEAYQTLHRLGRAQPSKTVYFDGFEKDELRPVDAAMLYPQHETSPQRGN